MHDNQKKIYKYIMLLGMIFAIVNSVADPLAYKMVVIGPFLMSVGVFIVPLSYACSDIITEVYGYKISRQIIWFGLLSELLFDLICYLAALIKSPVFFNNDVAFKTIFSPLLHVYFSVLLASIISDFVNIYCISKWKILLKGHFFWIRSIGSSSIAEFVFTAICDGLVFFTALPNSKVIQTIFSTFTIKIICAIILSLPMSFIATRLKKTENIDAYDYDTNFSPFKLAS